MLLIKKKLLNRFTYRCHSIDVDHKAQEGALVVGPLKKKNFFWVFPSPHVRCYFSVTIFYKSYGKFC